MQAVEDRPQSEFLVALNPPSVIVAPNSELGGPRKDIFSQSGGGWEAAFICVCPSHKFMGKMAGN